MNRSVQDVARRPAGRQPVHAGGRHRAAATGPASPARRRPSWAARSTSDVLRLARERHPLVQAGVFGADMQVHLVNDGPVTIPLTMR